MHAVSDDESEEKPIKDDENVEKPIKDDENEVLPQLTDSEEEDDPSAIVDRNAAENDDEPNRNR